jgi:putative hydrolase of the HAD superfamily
MIKWILFDQGKVQTYGVFSRKNEYSMGNKKFSAKELESIFVLPEYTDFCIGKMDEKKIISIFLKRKKIDLSIKEYIELFKAGIEPMEGMREILNSLSKRFNLATLINESSKWAGYKLDVPGFRKFFKINIISGDLGMKKPDLNFYRQALTILKAKPEECIFIDDIKENINAAASLGFKTVLFTDSKQLKNDLIPFDIEI